MKHPKTMNTSHCYRNIPTLAPKWMQISLDPLDPLLKERNKFG